MYLPFWCNGECTIGTKDIRSRGLLPQPPKRTKKRVKFPYVKSKRWCNKPIQQYDERDRNKRLTNGDTKATGISKRFNYLEILFISRIIALVSIISRIIAIWLFYRCFDLQIGLIPNQKHIKKSKERKIKVMLSRSSKRNIYIMFFRLIIAKTAVGKIEKRRGQPITYRAFCINILSKFSFTCRINKLQIPWPHFNDTVLTSLGFI